MVFYFNCQEEQTLSSNTNKMPLHFEYINSEMQGTVMEMLFLFPIRGASGIIPNSDASELDNSTNKL
jgi:hypothetical protein